MGIYDALRVGLEGKEVNTWLGEHIYLLDCTNCEVEYSCCMKRALMLAMTRKMLQWLRDNEAHLQDIDYADGVDYCDVKIPVYDRASRSKAWWRNSWSVEDSDSDSFDWLDSWND